MQNVLYLVNDICFNWGAAIVCPTIFPPAAEFDQRAPVLLTPYATFKKKNLEKNFQELSWAALILLGEKRRQKSANTETTGCS